MFDINLKTFFTAVKIAKRLEIAPPIKTTVMDALFPASVRMQHESPVIPVSEIQSVVHCVPVVRRGAESVPMNTEQLDNIYVEPLPVRVRNSVKPVELNNLKLMDMGSKEQWATRKTLAMRQAVRLTAEVLCAQAVFNGQVSYPLLLDNGAWETYQVTYNGSTAARGTAAAEKWDHADASLATIYNLLEDMATSLDAAGYGGTKTTWVGRLAYTKLLTLIEATDKPKLPVRINEDGSVTLGGHIMRKMAEVYRNPQTKASTPKIPDKEIRMVVEGFAAFWWGPVDDLDSNLKPMPLFVKPIQIADPSELRIVGESKPLPAVSPGATMKAIVLA